MKSCIIVPLLALAVGCSPAVWDASKEAARVACIIANAELPDARILAACQLAPSLLDFVHAVAGEQRAAVKREFEKPGVCKPAPVACVYVTGYREAYVDVEGVSR